MTTNISSTPRITWAPSRRRRFEPAARGSSASPGTAPTVRPRSRATEAVFRAPDLYPASTTRVIRHSPAMIRLRRGKQPGKALVPGSTSDTSAPFSWTSRCSVRCPAGYGTSTPVPRTAIVRPPAATAASWAAASIPRASPATTTSPAFTAPAASRWAMRTPYAEAPRVPTIATRRSGPRSSAVRSPSNHNPLGRIESSPNWAGRSGAGIHSGVRAGFGVTREKTPEARRRPS